MDLTLGTMVFTGPEEETMSPETQHTREFSQRLDTQAQFPSFKAEDEL